MQRSTVSLHAKVHTMLLQINLKRKPKKTPSKSGFDGFDKTLAAEGGEQKKKRKAERGGVGSKGDPKRARKEEILKGGNCSKEGLARGESGIKGMHKTLGKEVLVKPGDHGEKGKPKKAMVVSEGVRNEMVEAYRGLMRAKGAKQGRR